MLTKNSPFANIFLPGPVQNAATGIDFGPLGPTIFAVELWTIRGHMPSALGVELQRLPHKLARDRI